jgi:hypothetical protein
VHGTRRSTRAWRPTQRYLQGKEQEAISLSAAASIAEYDEECKTFIDDVHRFSVLASKDGDTMYWDQAIKQHNWKEFIKPAVDKITTHQENGHWKVVPLQDVPQGTPVLIKRQRRLMTKEVYKHKSRLNA